MFLVCSMRCFLQPTFRRHTLVLTSQLRSEGTVLTSTMLVNGISLYLACPSACPKDALGHLSCPPCDEYRQISQPHAGRKHTNTMADNRNILDRRRTDHRPLDPAHQFTATFVPLDKAASKCSPSCTGSHLRFPTSREVPEPLLLKFWLPFASSSSQ